MRLMLQGIASVVCLIAGIFMVGIGQNGFPPNRFLTIPGGCLILAGFVLVWVWSRSVNPFWVRCPHCGKQTQRTLDSPQYCPYCGKPLNGDANQ